MRALSAGAQKTTYEYIQIYQVTTPMTATKNGNEISYAQAYKAHTHIE